jgi:HlyD family secretion protein
MIGTMSQTSNTSPATRPGTTKPGEKKTESGSSKPIFRKAALERLSSPEQLDYLMSITSPVAWIMLSALGMICFMIVLWGFLGKVPDKVTGKGILIRGGAVLDVEAGAEGFIQQILVKPGDFVKPGDRVATIIQADLDLKISQEQSKLRDLRRQDEQMTTQENKTNNFEFKGLEEQDAASQNSIDSLRVQEKAAEAQIATQKQLKDQGLATQASVNEKNQNLFAIQQQINENFNRLAQNKTKRADVSRSTQETRNQRSKEIDESSRKLEEYQKQREGTTQVLSPYHGRVLEKLVERGNLVTSKQRILTLETNESNMQAVIFIPAGNGKKVQAGMEIQISPSTVKSAEYGFIIGKVNNVSYFPSTPDGMQRVLRNDQLVKELSTSGSPIGVDADLVEDHQTASGYKWSSSKGPPNEIFSGTPCDANIIVAWKRPVEFVIPKIKETFGLQ